MSLISEDKLTTRYKDKLLNKKSDLNTTPAMKNTFEIGSQYTSISVLSTELDELRRSSRINNKN